MSQLSVDFAMALSSTFLAPHSALLTEKHIFYTKPENCLTQLSRKTLTIQYGRQQLCFLLLTNGVTQGHLLMTNGTKYCSSWIGDELIQEGKNVVKIWSQRGTILVSSSFEHKNYHHQTPAPTTPGSHLDCGQPQGHHAGAPS